MEGCITIGLGFALKEVVKFTGGDKITGEYHFLFLLILEYHKTCFSI
jgi:hypothetical protein